MSNTAVAWGLTNLTRYLALKSDMQALNVEQVYCQVYCQALQGPHQIPKQWWRAECVLPFVAGAKEGPVKATTEGVAWCRQ